jgi:hypothetical protein
MNDIQTTKKIVFKQEVEPTKKTVKLPVELVNIDLESGKGILKCIAFKNETAKNSFIKAKSKFKTDKEGINSEIAEFKKDYDAAKNELKGGGNPKLRKELSDRKKELDERIKSLKVPILNPSESMVGNFEIKISDLSIFDSLVDQIEI